MDRRGRGLQDLTADADADADADARSALCALPYRPGRRCRLDSNCGSLRRPSGSPGYQIQEQAMIINRNQIRGRTTELTGKINEIIGKILRNRQLQARGRFQGVIGKTRAALGDAAHKLGDSSKKGA
jgi:uncharacterized protein YjbJ (UPF0337 family)